MMSVLFFVKRESYKTPKKIFAIILLLFSYEIFYSVLYWSQFDMTLYAILNFTYLLPLSLYGPLFYFYLRQLDKPRPINKIDFFHFFPFIMILIQNIKFYILPASQKIYLLTHNNYNDFIFTFKWDYLLVVLLLLGYGLFSVLKFRNIYKDDIEMNLWVHILVASFFIYTITHLIYCIIVYSNLNLESHTVDYALTSILVIVIGITAYFAHIHPSVFNGTPIKNLVPFVKYKKTGLSKEFSLELKIKLDSIMNLKKPYLEPDVRLNTLADMLDISRNHASQIINEHYLMSFYDFINSYRIMEAKKMLISKKDNYSVSEIAYKCGFNNRMSFYNAFKKFVGLTPKEYQKQNFTFN